MNYVFINDSIDFLFTGVIRLFDSTLAIILSLKRFFNRQLSFAGEKDNLFELYEFLLVLALLMLSVLITKKLLVYIPVKYFKQKNKLTKTNTIFILYSLISLIIAFSFDSILIIILLFVFMNLVIPLFIIDFKIGYLPDVLIYPLLWLGLLYQIWLPNGNVVSAIYAVMLSYIVMSAITTIVESVKKRPQMGRGDFKLIAACSAWLGILHLPYFLALAAFLGLVQYGVVYLKSINNEHNGKVTNKEKGINKQQLDSKEAISIPFGPAIIISASIWLYLSVMNNPMISQP